MDLLIMFHKCLPTRVSERLQMHSDSKMPFKSQDVPREKSSRQTHQSNLKYVEIFPRCLLRDTR